MSDTRIRYINRVVLVNDRGDRVLDTLVRQNKYPEHCKLNIKDGLKQKMFRLAEDLAPSLETVAEVIANIVKDKPVAGYHLTMKLTDIGYWEKAIAIGGTVTAQTY